MNTTQPQIKRAGAFALATVRQRVGGAFVDVWTGTPGAWTGPLDGLANLAGAYGYRQLLSAWEGGLTRVRRSSDNAETDVYGDTATAARHITLNSPVAAGGTLGTWLGAASAYLTTEYDQTGGGKHRVQATAAQQPQVAAGGALYTDGTGRPRAFYNEGQRVQSSAVGVKMTTHVMSTSDAQIILFYDTAAGTSRWYGIAQSGSGVSLVSTGSHNWASTDVRVNGAEVSPFTRGGYHAAITGGAYRICSFANLVIEPGGGINSSYTGDLGFGWRGDANWGLTGYVGDTVYASLNDATLRAAIEAALNPYWGAY